MFNTILGGHDDVDEDEMPGARETGSTGYTSSVQEVTPKEAVQMEKCSFYRYSHVITKRIAWECL